MKASPLPVALLAAALLFAGTARECLAADTVVRKNKQILEGTVVGSGQGNLRIKVGEAIISVPLVDVEQLRMQPPAEFAAAAAQLARGEAKEALRALEQLGQNYQGLPAPWAEHAAVMLGDAKLATGDKEGAKAAYEEFRKSDPLSVALANLGMARLAVESGDLPGASRLLEPLATKSATVALPSDADGPAFSQAFYLLGRIDEAAGDKSGALENYLKASALFPFDQNAVAEARKRADALRAEDPGLIAP